MVGSSPSRRQFVVFGAAALSLFKEIGCSSSASPKAVPIERVGENPFCTMRWYREPKGDIPIDVDLETNETFEICIQITPKSGRPTMWDDHPVKEAFQWGVSIVCYPVGDPSNYETKVQFGCDPWHAQVSPDRGIWPSDGTGPHFPSDWRKSGPPSKFMGLPDGIRLGKKAGVDYLRKPRVPGAWDYWTILGFPLKDKSATECVYEIRLMPAWYRFTEGPIRETSPGKHIVLQRGYLRRPAATEPE